MISKRMAYLSLGSNIGDRESYVTGAIRQLDLHPEIAVLRCSHLYETEPVGYAEQPEFLNMAAALATDLDPFALLRIMQDIERAAGRVRDVRWGPRTLDLDLLWMSDTLLQDEKLTLPHPRMLDRAFVLIPLLDIVQETVGLTREFVAGALEKLDGKEEVKLWKRTNWHNVSAPSGN